MSTKEDAKTRAIFLKRLREQHKETVDKAQARLKEQKAIRRQICQPTRDEPKTIPEIAALTGIPAHEVLWHITAMKKYGLVTETGMCGEYYLYQRVEEPKK
ncbi:MAG: helix-turn-helix transcriptional regulator [Ardenticatenaceae bacterium]|nr:helix-turn-helix transcriptional regulator [Anaerolineales bacterium]MCB8978831.1 helix-turn-helix transcriptional regulator [Ardenticatenaceae bacterium]